MKTCPKCKSPCKDDVKFCICGYYFSTTQDLPSVFSDIFDFNRTNKVKEEKNE